MVIIRQLDVYMSKRRATKYGRKVIDHVKFSDLFFNLTKLKKT